MSLSQLILWSVIDEEIEKEKKIKQDQSLTQLKKVLENTKKLREYLQAQILEPYKEYYY